jgi:hypothetical protein
MGEMGEYSFAARLPALLEGILGERLLSPLA